MLKLFITLTFGIILSINGFASQIRYILDTANSTLRWEGRMYLAAHSGYIKAIDGYLISQDGKIIDGSFIVDMNSITCTTVTDEESYKSFIDFLKGSEFFWTKRYPESKLGIIKVTERQIFDNKKMLLQIKAMLEIRNIKKEIVFPAELTFTEDSILAKAKVNVDRTLWGIKFGSAKLGNEYGDYTIDDIFTLDLNFLFYKEPTKKGE